METLRGCNCRAIRDAVTQHTEGALRSDLAVATRYAYDAACARASGNERIYAVAGLRVQALTASALRVSPTQLTGHLVAAIGALLRDDMAAVSVHLQCAIYRAAVTVEGKARRWAM